MTHETKELEGFTIRHGGPDVKLSDENLDALNRVYCESVFEPNEVEEYLPKKREYFAEHFLKNSNTVIIFDEAEPGKVVAFGGEQLKGVNPTNKKSVFELKALVVHPDYQGRGLSKVLTDTLETNIKRRFPQGCMIGMLTRNPRVIAPAEKKGYENVGNREFAKICDWDPDHGDGAEIIRDLEARGFTSLVMDVEGVSREPDFKGKVGITLKEVLERVRNCLGTLITEE